MLYVEVLVLTQQPAMPYAIRSKTDRLLSIEHNWLPSFRYSYVYDHHRDVSTIF